MSTIASIEARALAPRSIVSYTARSDEVFATTTLVRITDADGIEGIGA